MKNTPSPVLHQPKSPMLIWLKQGPNESATDFCFALEQKFIRLNVNSGFYKLIVFMDCVLPHLSFEIHKCAPAPKTNAEAKTMALNLEFALRERSHQAVSTVVNLFLQFSIMFL